MTHRVERARTNEGLDRTLVAHHLGHLVQEILERGETSLFRTSLHDRIDDRATHVLDGVQAKADRLTVRRKVTHRRIHVRGQDRDVHVAALRQVERTTILVVLRRGQQGRHVLRRVVRLQERRPVGDEAIGRRVRLVEGVRGEGNDDVPQGLNRLFGVAVIDHALAEALELLVQDLLLLLTHGLTQNVCLAQRVTGQLLRDLHDLLLIHDQTEGRAQDVLERFFQLRVDGRNLLTPVLTQRVVGVRVRTHRARTVQGTDGGDVFEVVGLHELEEVAHATTIELEDAEGLASSQQLIRLLIVEGQVIEVRVRLAVERDVFKRIRHNREVTQAQEVHLEQAQRLARRVVELRDDRAVLRALHDRDDVGERVGAHDDRTRVHAPLARQPLQAERVLDDLVRVGILLVELTELRGLGVALVLLVEDAVDRDVLAHDRRGQSLGELLADFEVLAQNARGVLQGLLGLNRAVGDDLANAVLAVLALDVGDDLVAPTFVEVDVEVRHGDSLGVEESLENQAVIEGVQLGDLHGVGDHRSGTRSTTGPHADALRLRPVDVVGDGEEVAGEAHRNNDVFLVLGLLAHGVRNAVREAITQASFDLLDEPRGLILPLGDREVGHVVRALLRGREMHVAALGDLEGRVAGTRQLTPQGTHLVRGTDVVAVAVELKAIRIVDARTGVDAQERVLDLAVVALDVVRVVGGHQGRVHELGDLEDLLVSAPLDVDAMVHDLDVEVLRPENIAQLRRLSHGLVPLPQAQARLHGTRGAAREHDEALVELVEQLLIRARPLTELAVRRGVGTQAEQVMHARRVVGDEGQVIVGAARAHIVGALPRLTPQNLLAIKTRGSRRDVGLQADDRLHAGVRAVRVEIEGTEQVAMIRQADRRLPEARSLLGHRFRLRSSVEHRVLGVIVKVHEGISHASILLSEARARPTDAPRQAVVHLTA